MVASIHVCKHPCLQVSMVAHWLPVQKELTLSGVSCREELEQEEEEREEQEQEGHKQEAEEGHKEQDEKEEEKEGKYVSASPDQRNGLFMQSSICSVEEVFLEVPVQILLIPPAPVPN